MLTVADCSTARLAILAGRYGASLRIAPIGGPIPGSYWGAPEAGLVGNEIHVTTATPIHSFAHELSHYICMTSERRRDLDTDAGGGELEECGVCFLQVQLAVYELGIDRSRLFRDMDEWGYSFRMGSTHAWFTQDSEDAAAWLQENQILDRSMRPTGALRN